MEEVMQFLASLPPEQRLESVVQAFADSKRLDKLQALNEKGETGTCLLKVGSNGWRLYETNRKGSDSDVRGAIDRFFAEVDPEGEIFT